MTPGSDVTAQLLDVTGRDLNRRIVVIERIEDLAHAATLTEDRTVDLLDDLLQRGVTVVVGSRSEQALDAERHLREALSDPTRLTALALHRSPAPEGALV